MTNETAAAYTELEAFFAVVENRKQPREKQIRWKPKSLEAKVIRDMEEIKAWMNWKGRTYGNT